MGTGARRRCAVVITTLAAAGFSSAPAAAGEGPAPGPALLHEPPPVTAQLSNHDPRFVAPFDRVSGTERYVDGEYLYTDHIYDDQGSDADGDGGGPRAEAAGSITYPLDTASYGDNGADLVELRLSTRGDDLAVRFTLNTLLVPDAAIAVLALDSDGDAATGSPHLPHDPGAAFPGTDHVLTTWGTGASWARWDGSRWREVAVASRADLDSNQITVDIPPELVPGSPRWRATAAVGLHDRSGGGWLRPAPRATATRPGGAGRADPEPSGIFNLAFRFDEPALTSSTPPDTAQAAALRDHDPTRFAHEIDVELLKTGGRRTSVPTSGTMIRFHASGLELGEGRVWRSRGGAGLLRSSVKVGRLQPYSVYVPPEAGTRPAPFTLYLHSLNQHHWQYNGSAGLAQVGAARGAVVAVPEARGSDGWYEGIAEVDVFEVWRDLANHLRLDAVRTTIAGYSMGGHGTYRLAALYPDLFARAATVVGPPGEGIWVPPAAPIPGGSDSLTNGFLENLRNVPILNLAAVLDELVPILGAAQQNVGLEAPGGLQSLRSLGYRFRFATFPTADHFTLGALGYDLPMVADHLADESVDRNPDHVTFSYVPATDDPDLGLIHDKAYWVSDLRLAHASRGEPSPKGTVDAVSHARGHKPPGTVATSAAGTHPLPWVETGQAWTDTDPGPPSNSLSLDLTNLSSLSVHLARAGLSTAERLTVTVTTTDDAEITLVDSATTRVLRVGAPGGTFELEPPSPPSDPTRPTPAPQLPVGGPRGPQLPATGGPSTLSPGLALAVAALSASAVRRLAAGGRAVDHAGADDDAPQRVGDGRIA